MLVGMGFVYTFLSMLIVVIKFLIAPLATKYPDPEPKARPIRMTSSSENESSTAIVAAISVAVSQYRKKHQS